MDKMILNTRRGTVNVRIKESNVNGRSDSPSNVIDEKSKEDRTEGAILLPASL